VNIRPNRVALVVMLALCLAACGKKGAPGAPKDEPNTYPRAYPATPGQPSKLPDGSVFPDMGQGNTNADPTRSPE